MNNYGRDRLFLDDMKIKFKDEVLIEIIPHVFYEKCFQLKYSNGEVSDNFWNLTRAKEHAIDESLKMLRERQIQYVVEPCKGLSDALKGSAR